MATVTHPESIASPTLKPPAKPPADRPVMTGWLATLLAIVTTIIGLILLAWSILYITKGRFLKGTFERTVAGFSNRAVKVGGDFQFYFDPIDLKFRAENMTIDNPDWAAGDPKNPRRFFDGKLIDARVKTFASIFGKRRLESLILEGTKIDLSWNRAGRNTWTFSDQPGEPFDMPVIERGRLAGTEVRYRDPRMQIAADIKIDTVEARDSRFANAIRFSGGGSARNTPFTLSGALLSPNATVAGGKTQLELNLAAVRTNARIWGTLNAPTDIEGAALNADVRGRNLRDIFAVAGIAVPETRAYRIRSALTKAGNEWRFTRMVGRYGASDISGWLTVALIEPRMKLTGEFLTRSLAMADIAPFVGYDPDKVATQGAQAAVPQTGGTPRLLPDAPLNVESLKLFDAAIKYVVRDVKGQNVPISNAQLTLTLDDRLLKLAPFNFDMARGHVDSDIIINARDPRVVTDYDIRLSPTPLSRLLAGWGVEQSGTAGTIKARVKMKGVGNTVRDSLATSNGRIAVIMPKGTFWARNIQLSELDGGVYVQRLLQKRLQDPVDINCGLIAFTVRDGIAAADPILVDSRKNVLAGKGGFSFRNEALDLALRADSKKFSLLSGQAPIGIKGYFAQPGIDVISPQLLTRAGVGLGIVTLVNPLAGILAFVDFGDAKAAACGPILQGATASAQLTDKGKPRKDVGDGTTKVEEPKKKKKVLGIF